MEQAFHFSTQLELFPWSGATQWLPDESLFSLVSRYHQYSGNTRAAQTCCQLFGHHLLGSAHDLPSRVDELVRRTKGELGSAQKIIFEHTVLPFYLPFQSQVHSDSAIAAMRGDRIKGLKYRLGLLTSRFRAHHPLKACARCLTEDRIKFGVAYWHMSHQYPGVWICPIHEFELLESTIKSSGVGRFQWCLPHETRLATAGRGRYKGVIPSIDRELLLSLTLASTEMAKLPVGFHFNLEKLQLAYRAGLIDKHLCDSSGRMDLRNIGKQYLAFGALFRSIPELQALPTNEKQAAGQVSRMFYKPRSGIHPLRHLLVALWLFDSWNTFWKTYCRFDVSASCALDLFSNRVLEQGKQNFKDSRILHFFELIRDKGFSVTRAAREVGVDTSTGMAWAALKGISTSKRAKVLKGDTLSSLRRDLQRGMDKSVVAREHGVSHSSVSRILRTEVGLHQTWRESRFAHARKNVRSDWRRTVLANKDQGMNGIRQLVPAAYAWLYRNDRAWLLQQKNKFPKAHRTNNANINWNDRDLEMAASIYRIHQHLSQTEILDGISVQHFCYYLPHLKAKLDNIKRLPQTYRALKCCITRSINRDGRKEWA